VTSQFKRGELGAAARAFKAAAGTAVVGQNVAVTDLSVSSGARGAGERALGEENLDRWAHTETTVPDWWGQKDAGTHWQRQERGAELGRHGGTWPAKEKSFSFFHKLL
jgi:hypothetical protein